MKGIFLYCFLRANNETKGDNLKRRNEIVTSTCMPEIVIKYNQFFMILVTYEILQ